MNSLELKDIKFDCKYFKGTVPCKPNKEKGEICPDCQSYLPIDKRILIIKLGATGDVIRTTPLVVKYRQLYPDCHITWLTHSPEVLPPDEIDEILPFDFTSVYSVLHRKFDIAVNLDKETEACSLLADVQAGEKYGYIWENNHIGVATPAAIHKLMTGLFDEYSQKNTRHYLEEIFDICHLPFHDEPYLLNYNKELVKKFSYVKEQAQGKKIIGLNTGCGARWKTRLWTPENWSSLAQMLQGKGYFPLFLGGPAEDASNREMALKAGAFYPGYFSREEFIALSSLCDLVVTQVSMMMHIATALQKPLVLLNNIFNRHEFYLYHRGIILEPTTGCDCFYGTVCKRERSCMLDITPQMVFNAILQLLPEK